MKKKTEQNNKNDERKKGIMRGYARVSLDKQSLTRQIVALKNFGVKAENIYKEKRSGRTQKNRTELTRLLADLKEGDIVVVDEFSRFARNLRDYLSIIEKLASKKAGIISIKEPYFSTTDDSPHGEFIRNIMMSLAQFDVKLISQRTKEGLAVAAAHGRHGGRPKGLSEKNKLKALKAQEMWENRDKYKLNATTVDAICKALHICQTTFYKYKNLKLK
ncbi:MAG: recombinase family protein [Prevotellaceae bacterium]|jgi:DNA invertase Pin-like site-specific DNA recombinase|nr:recombinase family protein [Prevotellaceae bacterium]